MPDRPPHPDPVHRHVVCGVHLELPCRLALPEAQADAPAMLHVTGQTAPLPQNPPAGAWIDAGNSMWVRPDAVLAGMAGYGMALVERGRGLTLDIAPGAEPLPLTHLLCGHVMGAILHLHGVLPLHASCLTRGGRAIAIVADRGSGKSTLAAALALRGWRPVADDLVAVTVANSAVLAWPGPPRFRLSPGSLAALGLPPDAGIAWVRANKRLVPAPDGHWHTGPVPLVGVIRLTVGDSDLARPRLERLPSVGLTAVLAAHSFRRRLIAPLGIAPDHAARCLEAARRLVGFVLNRPDRLDGLEALADTVAEAADRIEP